MTDSNPSRNDNPGGTERVGSETDVLLEMLANQRAAFAEAVAGLTVEQTREVPTVSSLSLATLLAHAIDGERSMTDRIAGVVDEAAAADPVARWQSGWRVGDDETTDDQLSRWRAVADRTERVVRAEADLGRVVDIPAGARRWLPNPGAYTVRWLLAHELEELARHAGHADLLREAIDGAVGHIRKQTR